MKLTPRKYAQALVEVLHSAADPKEEINNFLLLLRKKKQIRLLPKILQAFEILWAEHQGVVKIEVSYPAKFQSSVVELERRLTEVTGKKMDIIAREEKGLIGGFKVKFGDTLIDASLRGRLHALSKKLNN
jgi:F-type H+-transporting ATPase subunit delta